MSILQVLKAPLGYGLNYYKGDAWKQVTSYCWRELGLAWLVVPTHSVSPALWPINSSEQASKAGRMGIIEEVWTENYFPCVKGHVIATVIGLKLNYFRMHFAKVIHFLFLIKFGCHHLQKPMYWEMKC